MFICALHELRTEFVISFFEAGFRTNRKDDYFLESMRRSPHFLIQADTDQRTQCMTQNKE